MQELVAKLRERWPVWAAGEVVLVCADCLDVLPLLEAGSVDCVVTDIPYGEVNNRYESQQTSGPLRKVHRGQADELTFTLQEIVPPVARVSRGGIYIWCGTEQVSELRRLLASHTGNVTRLCIWEKTNPSPMNGDKFWLSSIECCVFCHMPKAWFSRQCKSPVWRGPIQREQVHPSQKPEWLMEELVLASTPIGGTCLDFCFGSGTTGVACVRTGRRFIGIEKEPEYFRKACKRIGDELARHPLLEPPPAVQRSFVEDVA